MDNDVTRRAEERRRKVIANAEARLKKITDMAKLENKTDQNLETPSNDEFVDFEVDSFVNEPTIGHTVTRNGSLKFPNSNTHSNPSGSSSGGQCSSSTESGESRNLTNEDGTVRNGFSYKTGSNRTQLDNSGAEELARLFANGRMGTNNFMFPPTPSGYPGGQSLPNGLNRDVNNPANAMANLMGGLSQNPAELSNLLNALSGLASGPIPNSTQQPPPEEIHPALKPLLNIIVFLALGVVARIFFQFSTLNINVFAPFLCLAIPLAIMSWGRRPSPMTGLLSAVLLFVRNPRTQAFIVNWVRLTTLLRGLSRLFASYFFTFVLTHVLFELSSISTDINEHSSPVN